MGKVSFWGIHHGLGVTSATAALAAYVGLEYDVRTLVCQPQNNDGALERYFIKTINQYNSQFRNVSGTGLDSLERTTKSGKLEREMIKNNTFMLERNRLDLLEGSERLNKPHPNSIEAVNIIFQKANDYYAATFLDTNSGPTNPITEKLHDSSDLIVVCLNQDIAVLEKYFDEQKKFWPQSIIGKPHILLMTQYDPFSKYKIKNIANKYNYKGKILTLPYNTSLRDHLNDGDVKSFFSRNRYVWKNHENYYFIQEVGRAAQTILNEIGINTKLKQIERGD